jgi:uncharacterized protein (DUF169 family)
MEEGTVKCLSFAPLDKCPFKPEIGGGVVALTCTPKQGTYLARAAVYRMGGMVKGMVGPDTTSMILAWPLQTGEMVFTTGCLGGRLYSKTKTEELYFSFPIEILEEVVNSLEVQLRDRPDLDKLLDEGVGVYHVATEKEKNSYMLESFMEGRSQ